jgi:hypothetical protein
MAVYLALRFARRLASQRYREHHREETTVHDVCIETTVHETTPKKFWEDAIYKNWKEQMRLEEAPRKCRSGQRGKCPIRSFCTPVFAPGAWPVTPVRLAAYGAAVRPHEKGRLRGNN